MDTCIALFRKYDYSTRKFNLTKGITKGQTYKERFAHASKSINGEGKNIGHPDIFSVNNDRDNPLVIIVECKRHTSDHGANNSTDLQTAVGGVRHYMSCFWELGTAKEDVVGVAFSGTKDNYRVSFFALCSAQNKPLHYTIKELGVEEEDKDKKFIPYPLLLNEVYSFSNLRLPSFSLHSTLYCSMRISQLAHFKISKSKVQRYSSDQQVEEIVDHLSQQSKIVPKGVLLIVVLDFRYHIIDGQHRLKAYKDLFTDYGKKFKVALQIINVDSEDELEMIYKDHYRYRNASALEREITDKEQKPSYCKANEILEIVQRKFGKKQSGRGRKIMGSDGAAKPYVDRAKALELLIEYLEGDGNSWLDKPIEEILAHIEELNLQLKKNPTKPNGKTYSEKILEPCSEMGCWLGLRKASEWLQ